MASLLQPPGIATLGGVAVRVIEHTFDSGGNTEVRTEFMLENVLPFEAIRTLKQRISHHHTGDPHWLPSQLFVGHKEAGDEIQPLEFTWSKHGFGATLPNPLTSRTGEPDLRLMDHGERKQIFPDMLSGITVEMKLTEPILHVWTMDAIRQATGFSGTMPPLPVLKGYFQLYFPELSEDDFTSQPAKESEETKAISMYLKAIDTRYTALEKGLGSELVRTAVSPRLRQLRLLRFQLPKHASFAKGLLELAFYEMEPTDVVPFMRFFPARDRGAPLVKMATKTSGDTVLSEALYSMYMIDQPSTPTTSLILLKAPIIHPNAPNGTVWTIHIYEDGSANAVIEAPRKNEPLPKVVVEEALRILPDLLERTPWAGIAVSMNDLVECSALYEFHSPRTDGKPSRKEMKQRLNAFLPLFMEEKQSEVVQETILLRFKAVSNFIYDVDPINRFITNLYLNSASLMVSDLNPERMEAQVVQEFGISPTEAKDHVQRFIESTLEYVRTDPDKDARAVAARNFGVRVRVEPHHPMYVMELGGAGSFLDMQRILSLLTVLTSVSSEDLRTEAAPVLPAASAAEVAEVAVEGDAAAAADAFDLEGIELSAEELAMMQGYSAEEASEVVSENTGAAVAANEVVAAEVIPAGELEVMPPMAKQWYLKKLAAADQAIFDPKFKPKPAPTPYASLCQKSSFKHPFVLDPTAYAKARTLYGDSVFWLEGPLTPYDDLATFLAYKTPVQRKTYGHSIGKTVRDLILLEKRALELGVELKMVPGKGGPLHSISQLVKTATAAEEANPDRLKQLTTAKDNADIKRLMEEQSQKYRFSVARLGSSEEKTNYYICGELWCVNDDLPLIPDEYEGKQARQGQRKKAGAVGCPFCGGIEFKDEAKPVLGETVIRRGKSGGEVQKDIGYLSDINHHEGYAYPCCFTKPTHLGLPTGAKPIPAPKVPLPAVQQRIPEESIVPAEVEQVIPEDESTSRPFSPMTKKDAKSSWYIPFQNILGRKETGWIDIGRGKVALPPPSVNALLGQNPVEFLEPGINARLKVPGAAFLRYSIGCTRDYGLNLLRLVAFANYAVEHYVTQNHSLSISPLSEVMNKLTSDADPGFVSQFIHGFEQANYGTLLHEFATPGKSITAADETEDGGFTVFQKRAGFDKTIVEQRPYLIQLYLAWKNFRNYIKDAKEPKNLRTWEGLFATPGLLTKTGFLLVRIQYPKQKDEPPTIHCPSYGVSIRSQTMKPPVLFLLENEATGFYDPLVFYSANSEANRKVVGVLQDTTDVFRSFPSEVQEPLRAFLTDYFSYRKGCGVQSVPIHPWMKVRSSRSIPRISELLAFFTYKDDAKKIDHKAMYRIVSLSREITNRLVGLVVKERPFDKSPHIFIPAVDDGTVSPTLLSLRGEESVPRPSVVGVLNFYTGRQDQISLNRLIHPQNFPMLQPVQLISQDGEYVAILLRCGLEIPVKPQSTKDHFDHRRFLSLGGEGDKPPAPGKYKVVAEERVGDMPWNEDRALLSGPEGSESMEATDEEVLDEAYQYLRISFSNWLFDPENKDGEGVRQQLEDLRKARKRLPLYELQKRLDILLTSILVNSVSPWITTEGSAQDSVLRRDCLQIKKEDACVAGCTWVPANSAAAAGRCLIHTQATPRFVDPIRVMVARLSDELLRTFGGAEEILHQSISYLKPVGHDMIRTGDSVLFAAKGRGDRHLLEKLGYTKGATSDFARGLRYPEEVGRDTDLGAELPADWAIQLQPAVFSADIARDPRARFVTSLVAISKQSLATLEAGLGKPMTGTKADWTLFAPYAKQTIVFTKEVPGDLVVESVVKGGETYVILDPDGTPYQVKATGTFVVTEEQLPPRLRASIESA